MSFRHVVSLPRLLRTPTARVYSNRFPSFRLAPAVTQPSRAFSNTSTLRDADFTHAVIGGGVVGLAVARRLQQREGASVVVVERNGAVGMETSSRNSEVIHAGIYYGADSLKTKLCLRGKNLLYDLLSKHSIPHLRCGKWIVAQDDVQLDAIQKVHDFATSIGVPTRFLSKEEAKQREPDVRAEAGVLESPSTGIVDSHGLMQFLEGELVENGGIVALHSEVTGVSSIRQGAGGWEISINSTSKDQESKEQSSITAETVINAAGLYAIHIGNMILPPEKQRKAYYAKGSYFSYSSSHPRPKTLVYPAPVPGHGGLGTHLTLDISGRIRFGPDVEWIDSPTDYRVNSSNLSAALDDIQTYLPGIDRDAVGLDYAGIRPKLGKLGAVTSGKGFQDFWIRMAGEDEGNVKGWVNLLGIESPGLTSCLAIAEEVEGLLYGERGRFVNV